LVIFIAAYNILIKNTTVTDVSMQFKTNVKILIAA